MLCPCALMPSRIQLLTTLSVQFNSSGGYGNSAVSRVAPADAVSMLMHSCVSSDDDQQCCPLPSNHQPPRPHSFRVHLASNTRTRLWCAELPSFRGRSFCSFWPHLKRTSLRGTIASPSSWSRCRSTWTAPSASGGVGGDAQRRRTLSAG